MYKGRILGYIFNKIKGEQVKADSKKKSYLKTIFRQEAFLKS